MSEVWTKLRAVLSLDPAEFKAGAKDVASATTGMQSVVMKAAGAMGVAFSAAAVLNYAKEIARAANETVDAAKGLDMTTASLVGLQRVAGRQGTQGDAVIRWLQKLQDMSADLATSGGNSPLGKQLEAMGISVRDFVGLPLPERLMLLIQKSNESALGVSALNAALGKGAAIEAKDAFSDLAKDGLGSITTEANRAAKAIETLASVWAGGERGSAGLKNWAGEKLANIVDMNRLILKASRGGGPAPTGINAAAEGIGAALGTVAMNIIGIIHGPWYTKLYRSMETAAASSTGLGQGGKFGGRGASGKWGPAGETELQQQMRLAEEKRVGDSKDKSEKAVRALHDEYEKIIAASLEGEAKLRDEIVGAKMDYEQALQDIEKKYARDTKDEKNADVLASLKLEHDQTVTMLGNIRNARIRASEKQLQELQWKSQYAAIIDVTAAEKNLAEATKNALRSASGRGVSADSMAKIGGFMGGERPGLAIADKQLRVQEEIRDAVKALQMAKAIYENERNMHGVTSIEQVGGS